MWCEHCDKKAVKPNITFFGESLPMAFMLAVQKFNLSPPDLVLIMGTALAVSPFNSIPAFMPKTIPKVLFNMTNVKDTS
jgi:NAD-dependent SIR2 family protein deacetylase